MDNTTEFCLTAADGGVNQFEADASDEKEMGSCVICNAPTTKRCQACTDTVSGRKAPFYCGKPHQQEDWPQHKLKCLRTRISKYRKACKNPSRPVDFLVKCIAEDYLPSLDSPCYKPFGFSDCKSEVEEADLLSLYVGLIKLLEADIDEVEDASKKGELRQFICKEYETVRPDASTRGEYYPWFKSRLDILKDSNSAA